MTEDTFTWLDYTLFCFMLTISAGVGVYFGFFSKIKQNSRTEYLMGGKTMSVFPIGLSLLASNFSGGTLLAMPAEVYTFGLQIYMCCLSSFLTALLVAYIYMPLFYELQLTSTYEYLELRFGRSARTVSSTLYALSQIFYMPCVIYIPALAFSQVTGISVHAITPVILLICIFYTTFGGMRAVAWTDTLQSGIIFATVIVVIWIGTSLAGGPVKVWETAKKGGRLEIFDMDMNPLTRTTFWTIVFGLTLTLTAEAGIHHSSVQRYLSVPTLSDARKTGWILCIGLNTIRTMCCWMGLVMFTYYVSCDPLSSGKISKSDQVLPLFVGKISENIPGLSGLFIATVFSAALSTMSTGLNTLSGTIYEDFIKSSMDNPTEKTASNVMKATVAIIGLGSIGLVYLVEHLGSVLQLVYSISGVTQGVMLGLFTLGMFVPRANTKGALIATAISMVIVTWIMLGAQAYIAKGQIRFPYRELKTDSCSNPNFTSQIILNSIHEPGHSNSEVFWLYRIGYMYYSTIGASLVLILGTIISLLTEHPGYIKPSLLSPLIRRWAPKEEAVDNAIVQRELTELNIKLNQ